jgi:hypothetical protein
MAYADTSELFRILKIRTPSDEQEAAADRVLEVAAGEIDSELDLAADANLAAWQLELVTQVNLERAVEHWQQQEIAFGLVFSGDGIGLPAERLARDTWERHALKLAPAKNQWGIA